MTEKVIIIDRGGWGSGRFWLFFGSKIDLENGPYEDCGRQKM